MNQLGAVQIAEKEAARVMSQVMEKMFAGGALSMSPIAVKLDNHGPQHQIFSFEYDWYAVSGDAFGIETSITVKTRIIVKEKKDA